MKAKQISSIGAVLFAFFVMGFCDIVGISSDYAASAFGWSQTMAGLIPSVVFVWFFLLGVPFGVMIRASLRRFPSFRQDHPAALLRHLLCRGH